MDTAVLKRILCILLTLSLSSCAAGKIKEQEIKKQANASRELGIVYIHEAKYSLALQEMLKAEALAPEDSDIQNCLGLIYMGKKRIDLAINHFNKALDLSPNYTAARNNLATAYLAEEKWDQAIEALQKVLTDMLFTTSHFPLSNMGWAYYNKKQYDQAEKYYKEALSYQPKYVIAMRGLAKTYIAMNKIPDALSILEKALSITPRFAPLYMELGEAYTASGNYKEALNVYKKVTALFPESEFADEAKKKTGEIYFKSGR